MEKEQKISDIVPEQYKKRAVQVTEDHVDWFLTTIRPLLVTFGIHLYRHGFEDAKNEEEDG